MWITDDDYHLSQLVQISFVIFGKVHISYTGILDFS